ncbi:hypothetical protein FRC05_001157 [Tulasnella sp. 425]|nr:hypothetical protein FRC05_001157 [Tulasnella sp. 425]
MSSNVVYNNAQLVNNTPSHKKRPQHPSPVNSYRSAVERNGAMKRARWDISVVDPDDEPFFPLGGSDARTASTIDTAFAFERLRRSTFDEGESFVNKMREWERERSTQQEQPPVSHQLRIPDADKMGGLVGHEDVDGAMYSAASASYSSASPPYMSNSISSNSSTATSGSGSEGGPFAFGLSSSIGLSSQRPTLVGERKRSWSVVEEDDTTSAFDGGDMDWEVVATAQRPAIALRSKSTAQSDPIHEQVHTGDSSLCFSPSIEAAVSGAETAEDGDDEQEDSSSSIEDDSDDDLIFVTGNNMPSAPTAESAGQAVGVPEPSAVSTERMIAELSQVFAAGGADLEDHGMESEAFFELELGGENSVAAHGHDAGALWQ